MEPMPARARVHRAPWSEVLCGAGPSRIIQALRLNGDTAASASLRGPLNQSALARSNLSIQDWRLSGAALCVSEMGSEGDAEFGCESQEALVGSSVCDDARRDVVAPS